jgi:putative FmdB family regulatory protein
MLKEILLKYFWQSSPWVYHGEYMIYEYECSACGVLFDVSHSMTEHPAVKCSKCGSSDVFRDYSACGIVIKSTNNERFVRDHMSRRESIKTKLREDYGIHSAVPLQRMGLEDIYSEVKKTGCMIKDQMQENKAKSDDKIRKKHKAWRQEALKRTPQRVKEKKDRHARENAAKNVIRL